MWCFAYGSNMNKAVLQGRRMIKPAESVAAICPGYKLSFQQPGLPYREPGFATVEPLGPEGGQVCHGVAHRITPTEWRYYLETEGAAGQSDHGYGVIDVTLEAYDGRTIQAKTLQTQAKSIAWLRGVTAMPSERYLTLLRKGAEEHNLHSSYKEFLAQLKPYSPRGFGPRIGAFITSFIGYFLLFPIFGLTRLIRKVRGMHNVNPSSPLGRFQSTYFYYVFSLSWRLHDLLRPILGCGAATKTA